MRTSIIFVAGIFLAACGDDPSSLLGGRGESSGDGLPAEALQCSAKPEARSYAGFDGAKLEEKRVDENIGINRARQKPHAVLAGEYQRVLGVVPSRLAGAAASFDAPEARWYQEASHSGVSLNAFFDLSFDACRASVKETAPPTADAAKAFCSGLMRKAWSRTATPDEVSGCVDLATTKLASEPDPKRRWAYTCASILSSSHFLTF
jgi:hypothetical protein